MLQVRNAMMPGGKRRPSFKMVSNMVIQLLHSIKYSVEVPFSNMAQQPAEIQKAAVTKKVSVDASCSSSCLGPFHEITLRFRPPQTFQKMMLTPMIEDDTIKLTVRSLLLTH
jgi:hypothetical protein